MKTIFVENCPCCDSALQHREIIDWQKNRYVVCGQCDSWYLSPRVELDYEENYWGSEVIDPDGTKRDLKLERDFRIKNFFCGTIPYVNNLPPGNVLDIGAGLGFFLSALDSRWEKHALEISQFSLEFFEKEFPEFICHQGLLTKETFPPNSFDVVNFYHVIEHLPNPKEILNIIKKILRPKGVMIVGTPNVHSIVARWFQGNFRVLGQGHICMYNVKSLSTLLNQSGFKVVQKEFPYWGTEYATFSNMLKLFDRSQVSPPFWGNLMTLYTQNIK